MAASTKGTVLSYCTTSNGTFIVLANVENFQASKESVHRIDITDLSCSIETPLQGLVKIDDFSFECFYTEANFTALTSTLFNTAYFFKCALVDGSVIAFHGWLSEIEPMGGKPNESVKMKGKICIDTAPTYTVGS